MNISAKLTQRIGLFLLIWFSVVGIGSFLRIYPVRQTLMTYVEMFIHFVIFVVIFSIPRIREFFMSWPKSFRYVLLVFFSFMYIGQFTQKLDLTYPFTAWAMYSRPQSLEVVKVYRYEVTTESGEVFYINPEKILPANDKHVVTSKYKKLIDEAFFRNLSEDRQESINKLKSIVSTTVDLYNRKNNNDPIISHRIIMYEWNYRESSMEDASPVILLITQF